MPACIVEMVLLVVQCCQGKRKQDRTRVVTTQQEVFVNNFAMQDPLISLLLSRGNDERELLLILQTNGSILVEKGISS